MNTYDNETSLSIHTYYTYTYIKIKSRYIDAINFYCFILLLDFIRRTLKMFSDVLIAHSLQPTFYFTIHRSYQRYITFTYSLCIYSKLYMYTYMVYVFVYRFYLSDVLARDKLWLVACDTCQNVSCNMSFIYVYLYIGAAFGNFTSYMFVLR